MLKVGAYTVSAIETGHFALDGGAMFGVVPRVLWEKEIPPNPKHQIPMSLRAMLVQGPGVNLLVDCGMGHKWTEKQLQMYSIDHSKTTLDRALEARGLKTSDITHVILTHLHFDHAGGLTRKEDPTKENSPLVPTFSNAKIYLQKANWDQAWNPSEKDRASYLKENFEIYADSKTFGKSLTLLETSAADPSGKSAFGEPNSKEEEILPGISVRVSHGHTLGMELVRVSGEVNGKSSNILYCADLIPTSAHVRVPWIMAYDNYPLYLLKEKKQILNRAADEGSYLFYEHCPKMAASKVTRTPKGDFLSVDPIASVGA